MGQRFKDLSWFYTSISVPMDQIHQDIGFQWTQHLRSSPESVRVTRLQSPPNLQHGDPGLMVLCFALSCFIAVRCTLQGFSLLCSEDPKFKIIYKYLQCLEILVLI